MIKKQTKFTPKRWKRNTWQVSYINNCSCAGCISGRDIFNDIVKWAFDYSKDGYIGNDRIKFPLIKEQRKQFLKKFSYMSLSPYRRGWFLEQIFLDYNDNGFFLNLTNKEKQSLNTFLSQYNWTSNHIYSGLKLGTRIK